MFRSSSSLRSSKSRLFRASSASEAASAIWEKVKALLLLLVVLLILKEVGVLKSIVLKGPPASMRTLGPHFNLVVASLWRMVHGGIHRANWTLKWRPGVVLNTLKSEKPAYMLIIRQFKIFRNFKNCRLLSESLDKAHFYKNNAKPPIVTQNLHDPAPIFQANTHQNTEQQNRANLALFL